MKIKRILAKFMAFTMAFAAISFWAGPIEAYAATPVNIGFNEVSITVPVAEGQTASAIALDSEIPVSQISAVGGRITLGVVVTDAHAGQDIVVQLAILNALQDNYFLVLRVAELPPQYVSFRIVSPSD
ncbi:MAG: hypothetical protein LBE35_09805, partial [Clostridiales bacterium]|nr:hypothetical protein [Clostridiales bacterium]